jgi:hypothetical protein
MRTNDVSCPASQTPTLRIQCDRSLNGHCPFGPQAKGARNRILAARGRLVQLGNFGAPMLAQAIASEDAAWSKNPQYVPLPKAVLPEVRQNRQTRDEKLFAKS